jgi:fructose-bisphosphate aldolase/2-amino-3,7-dideoxy-D-threo-hept-6-ulosonate synthase
MSESDCGSRRVGDTFTLSAAGKRRRLARLLSPDTGKTVIVPIDDSLIFGPASGLEQPDSKLNKIIAAEPEAILAFPGIFRRNLALGKTGLILNLTASTIRSHHTRKVQVGAVEQAIQLGADAVAVHVNIGSKYESEMLAILGAVARQADHFGLALLAIMYPRTETNGGDDNYENLQKENPREYSALVAHAARVATDLGADLIKTKYTGSPDSFRPVVDGCSPVPVVVAGGPVSSPRHMLNVAHEVVLAGGAGVSFGRNVFTRINPGSFISAVRAVVHQRATVSEALETTGLLVEER